MVFCGLSRLEIVDITWSVGKARLQLLCLPPSPAHPAAGGQPGGSCLTYHSGTGFMWPEGDMQVCAGISEGWQSTSQGFLWVGYIRITTPLITVTRKQANAPPRCSRLPCEGSALGAYQSDFHSVLGNQQKQVNPECFCCEYEHRKIIALIQLPSAKPATWNSGKPIGSAGLPSNDRWHHFYLYGHPSNLCSVWDILKQQYYVC